MEKDKMTGAELQQFLSEVSEKRLQLEIERQESIIAQSGRNLVFLSLISAAIFSVLPTLLKEFTACTNCIWLHYIFLISTIGISLILLIISQWRFNYDIIPSVKTIENASKNETVIDQDKYIYWKTYNCKMEESISKNNNIRCLLLKISSSLLIVAITVVFSLITTIILGVNI